MSGGTVLLYDSFVEFCSHSFEKQPLQNPPGDVGVLVETV
jgi:hypothetical protein